MWKGWSRSWLLRPRAKSYQSEGRVRQAVSTGEAFSRLKELPPRSLLKSVDVAINPVDPRKSDQVVRVPPSRPTVPVRPVRFRAGCETPMRPKRPGGDIVGLRIWRRHPAGMMDFDVVIATPDAMRVVGQLGQILGPSGPDAQSKVGTVTPNGFGSGVAMQRRVKYERPDRYAPIGIIHCTIERSGSNQAALQQNLEGH